MKTVVIGGGITGCVVSSFLSDEGFKVYLYESSNRLGGILADIQLHTDWYYNYCQYLQKNCRWLDELIMNTNLDVFEFPHRYGSFTHTGSKEVISKDFAGSTFEYKLSGNEVRLMLEKAQIISEDSSLRERINCYPTEISIFLNELLKRQSKIHIDNLSQSCSIPLQISRIYLRGDEDSIEKIKSQYASLDSLLGLPRRFIYGQNSNLTAILPSQGFNNLFDNFQQLLQSKGVNIYTSVPVKCSFEDGKLSLIDCNNNTLNYDICVWAGSPSELLRLLVNKITRNYVDLCYTYIFELASSLKETSHFPFYIQCFSLDQHFRRIYLYLKSNCKQIISVETLQLNKGNLNEFVRQFSYVIEKFGYSGKIEFIGLKKHAKKILMIKDELLAVKKIKNILQNYNIIDGGWHLYGRESKIDYIKNRIKEMLDKQSQTSSFTS